MDDRRIQDGIARGRAVKIEVDGELLRAYEGETVAAALLAAGRRIFRRTPSGEPRGVYCGIGVCFDCVMVVNGMPNSRACQTRVSTGMTVRTQTGDGEWAPQL
jgi:predicted molibdopterin-dependent oxidoreductase YjgC